MTTDNVRKKGIYCIYVGGLPYVGKDWDIHRCKRIKQNLASLKRNKHWNKKMQDAYNKTHNFSSEVIIEFEHDIRDAELCEYEKYYIKEKDSYNNGYNQTLGGIGLLGVEYTEEQLTKKSNNMVGSNNPQSKLTLDDFKGIVGMLNANKTNSEIADVYGVHSRYVSLIRNKKRYKKWFEEHEPSYVIIESPKQLNSGYKLSTEDVVDIYKRANLGETHSKLSREYEVSRTTIKRIKEGISYKEVTDKIPI